MEKIKQPEKEINIHDEIKKDFLNGKIDYKTFRQKIIELDQKGTHVENAEKNIELLEDFQVKEKIFSAEKEMISGYYKILSLSYFHKAQKTLDINDFFKAYEYSLENFEDNDYQNWILYTKGTLEYLKKDEKELKNTIKMIDNGRNKEILKKFLKSLGDGEEPKENYFKNYFG